MGSLPETSSPVNLLEYLRSKTQVDCDSLDIQSKFASCASFRSGRDRALTIHLSSCYRAGTIRGLHF